MMFTALSAAVIPSAAMGANSSYPVPENVSAVKAGTNVTVSWDAPLVSQPDPTVEGFEDYAPYATEGLGEWTLLDLDKANHQGYYSGIDFSRDDWEEYYYGIHYNEPHSWQVYGDQYFTNPYVIPYEGKNVLSAWACFGATPADDWAISPELSGEAQTVTLRAKSLDKSNYETFHFYYSTGGMTPGDFVLVKTVSDIGGQWEAFSFDVPEGARYFALHYDGDLYDGHYGVAVDNIRYYAAGQVALSLTGFNVYRDGVKVNSDVINNVSFTDIDAAGEDHVYNVTAVYTAGESDKSADFRYEYVPDYDLNLAVAGFTAPEVIVAGKTAQFTVSVINDGRRESGQFRLVLVENGSAVESKDEESLKTGETRDIVFEICPNAFYAEENIYSAEIILEGDERTDNNRTEDVTVMFTTAAAGAPENLEGKAEGKDVILSWDAPLLSNPEPTLEDFESYGAYETRDLGDWTLIDLDGNRHQFYYDIDFENDVDAMDKYMTLYNLGPHSWMTYGDQLFQAPHIEPVSGVNVLSAWVSFGSEADDWAISPELSGESQTVRFKGKAINSERNETFSIYYSTGSKEPSDFILISTETGIDDTWRDFTFDVPDGAMYFAFHYCGDLSKNYGFAVDDIEYLAAGQIKPQLLGFNIYRDGTKLNDAPVNDVAFTDKGAADESHEYHATAMFNIGESAPAGPFSYTVLSAVEEVAAPCTAIAAVGGGISVTGLHGIVEVYSADGRLVATSTADGIIPVTNGLFVVKAGDVTAKVIVR